MNPIALHNLARHELIGLQVSVVQSSHKGYVGVRGKVVNETKSMLLISDGVKTRMVPKEFSLFCFTLPDNSTAEVEGSTIVDRPVERIRNG